MINITYDSTKLCLTVKGHAQSGEAGHDIICAAVSALTYTLAENILNYENAVEGAEAKIKLETGDAEICCICSKELESMAKLVFSVICAGFEKLAHTYPENISYEMVG